MADRRGAFALVLAVAMSGCSFAPAYHPPAMAPVAAFKEAGPWQPAAPEAAAAPGAWWHLFGDAQLDALEDRLDRDNPTLAGAVGRYDQARAYLAEAVGSLLPTAGLQADLSRNRQSDNRPLRGAGQPNLYSADTLGGQVSYELDLWGRVRNTIAARKAEAEAGADDRAAVKLSLEAELAGAYVTVRGDDARIRLLTATVDAFAKADAMIGRRFASGIASGVDTSRSGAQLAEAQAELADVRAARAGAEHAVASLIGTPAATFTLPPTEADMPPPASPAAVASILLQRRPDIAAAERRMAAANAEIGVAKAAFFPSLSLGAQGGVQSTGFAGLLAAPNLFWSVGPSTVLTLFDGGRRKARVAVARAGWDQATADYRAAVLRAFQQVEDSLAQLHYYGIEAEAETRAVAQASVTEQLSLNRYVKGAVSYLDVVTAQTTALDARRRALALHTQRLQASVDLVRALGGGWSGATRLAAASPIPLHPPQETVR